MIKVRANLTPAESEKTDKAMIIIHVDVIKILGILEDSEILSVQFNLTAIWQDPRLTYRNLKKENFKNIVSKSEGDTIWYPVVLFQNTPNTDQTLFDSQAIMTVLRNGSFKTSPKEILHNNHLYEGSQNYLSLSRPYKIDFQCQYHLGFYPFVSMTTTYFEEGNINSNDLFRIFKSVQWISILGYLLLCTITVPKYDSSSYRQ